MKFAYNFRIGTLRLESPIVLEGDFSYLGIFRVFFCDYPLVTLTPRVKSCYAIYYSVPDVTVGVAEFGPVTENS